ncbi:MAG: hypothetical protein IT292_09300 [Deltaproteobacteria bacterium]|nr:hypothetical protein [Deltaproteobacteria bacterium]
MVDVRGKMDTAARSYKDNANEFLKGQSDTLRKEVTEDTDQEKILEHFEKMVMANDMIDYGNAIHVANFRAQALRNFKLVEEKLDVFDQMNKKLDELKKITRQQANLDQIENTRKAAEHIKLVS